MAHAYDSRHSMFGLTGMGGYDLVVVVFVEALADAAGVMSRIWVFFRVGRRVRMRAGRRRDRCFSFDRFQ